MRASSERRRPRVDGSRRVNCPIAGLSATVRSCWNSNGRNSGTSASSRSRRPIGIGSSPRCAAAPQPLKVLNLFAYTGGSTIAAAGAGAEVVHVDAARNVVAWARRNAELSGVASARVRWIAEDAMKFARRELKRQNRYDAVILDPPSFGRGPHGEIWRLSKHLPWLLSLCVQLTAGRCRFLLVTCHTPGFTADRLRRMVLEAMGDTERGHVMAAPLVLETAAGRRLASGTTARWEAEHGPCLFPRASRELHYGDDLPGP